MCNITPIMKQYFSIKNNYKNELLFFQMGDFYELFYKDAEVASKLLSIVLTSRGTHKGKPISMAGIPCHSANSYIFKLVKLGKKVAICNQTNRKNNDGIIERKVVKIFTLGTFVEEDYFDSKEDNFICCIHFFLNIYGLAVLDLSTGYFFISEFNNMFDLSNELDRLNPVEILISDKINNFSLFLSKFFIDKFDSSKFNFKSSIDFLSKFFNSSIVCKLKKKNMRSSIISATYLINFVITVKKCELSNISDIEINDMNSILYMDARTRIHLEIFKNSKMENDNTLFSIINYTSTPMGKRLLKRWLYYPLKNKYIINNRLSAVRVLKNNQNYLLFKNYLKKIYDLERVLGRIFLSYSKPIDLKKLQISLENIAKIKKKLDNLKLNGLIIDVYNNIKTFYDLTKLIFEALVDNPPVNFKQGNIIKSGFDKILDKYRKIYNNIGNYIFEFENNEKNKTGISSLRVKYNNIDKYYIEVIKIDIDKIPNNYIKIKSLKYVNKYIFPDLKILEKEIFDTYNKVVDREIFIYNNIIKEIKKNIYDLKNTVKHIAILDVLQSFAEKSTLYNWIEPELVDEHIIDIKSGTHAVIENIKGKNFISNNLFLNKNRKILIITGSNMGGKSTYMRQCAIILMLAHIGSYVPAEKAKIGFIDKILTRIGSSDDLTRSCSTFMMEVKDISFILKTATKYSFILIDEIGRGTDVNCGIALGWSVLDYIYKINQSFSLVSTHLHELSNMSNIYEKIFNVYFNTLLVDKNLIFLYKCEEGSSNKSFGLEVASKAGLPHIIITNAYIKFKDLKINTKNMPEFLKIYSLENLEKIFDFLKLLDFNSLLLKDAFNILNKLKSLMKKN